MTIENHAASSEAAFLHELQKLSDAGGSLIQVRTREVLRAATALRRNCLLSEPQSPYTEWDAVNGVRRFTRENMTDHKTPGQERDFLEALMDPLRQLRNPTSEVCQKYEVVHYFVFVDPHPWIIGNPMVTELLQQYAAILPAVNVCIVLLTPDVAFSDVATGTLLVTSLKTPSAEELEGVLRTQIAQAVAGGGNGAILGVSELDEDDFRRISYVGLGLTMYEFETYTAISLLEGNEAGEKTITAARLLDGIGKGKTEVVKQSDILELIATENIANVGGMHRLKDWITQRSGCFSDEAIVFGIEPPKGFAVVGVPGTGKSLVAKATAFVLGIPAVRLDFGRVFSKFVGDSESRVRSALAMVESMAPCVLFVDEIDKGLGGAGGGGGDAGTSSRVLGSFLTWLQECKSKVFTIVTANRIEGLPPELLRRGRFDGIFSVGLPTAAERREVLAIHLARRNQSLDAIGDTDALVKVCEGYVPAEIESAVKDGLIMAFSAGEALSSAHVSKAFRDMVPMSRSHKEAIDRIVAWSSANATPVNYGENDTPARPSAMQQIGGKTVIPVTPRRRLPRGR